MHLVCVAHILDTGETRLSGKRLLELNKKTFGASKQQIAEQQ
jgi:hypothetical protein